MNFLLNSETPNLPAAKAIIKVILIYIPGRSAGGELATNMTVEDLYRTHDSIPRNSLLQRWRKIPPIPNEKWARRRTDRAVAPQITFALFAFFAA